MSIRVFIHTSNKRAETPALLDSGATENFINHQYASQLHLPVKRLATPRKIYNVDGTTNRKGDIRFFMDLEVRTGERRTNMRFFLTDLGNQQMILGYPWFAAVQPKIDWAKGWIDYTQLPVVIRAPNAHQAIFTSRLSKGRRKEPPNPHIRRTTERWLPKATKPVRVAIPQRYRPHAQVFSERHARRFPKSRIWDHAIDLKTEAVTNLVRHPDPNQHVTVRKST
jgi:hypothetical protein